MTPGERIKREREAQGVTRPELARLSGVPYPTLAGIENGNQALSTRLHSIATALRLNASWIETGKGSKFATAVPQASQAARPDPSILANTQEFLETAFAVQGKEFRLRADPDLFADAYAWLAEDVRPVDQRNLVDFGRWLAARQQATEAASNDGQQGAGTTRQTPRADRGRAKG